jgi:hypothetical protein
LKTMNPITDIDGLADLLPALIAALKTELTGKQAAMTALKTAGLIYAAEHWREGKYLYLIHPSRDGQRERKYIGANAEKIAEAKAGMQRAKDFDALASEASQVERKLRQGSDRLRDAVAYLSGARTW